MRTTSDLKQDKTAAYMELLNFSDNTILKKKSKVFKGKTPIVMQALSHWDGPYGSASNNLAKEFAKDRLVFYVDHPLTWKDVFQNRNSQQVKNRKKIWDSYKPYYQQPYKELENFINVCPKPVLPINGLRKGGLYEELKRINLKRIWTTVNEVLDAFGIQEFIYINSFDPVYAECLTNKKIALKVYHCVDNISGERYIAKHGVWAEQMAATKSDLVITTSDPLKEQISQFNDHTYTVPNGVDFDHFSQTGQTIPDDIAKIKGPKVLYSGNIGLRIDYELLLQAAHESPQYQFVFVGPINEREFKGKALSKLKNVHFLGAKPMNLLPAYIRAASVCIIPFLCNDLTGCIYPLKINEYLAVGKPIVTSNFSDLADFKNNIYTYNNVHKFLKQLNKALNQDSESEIEIRKKLAQNNTWKKRAESFMYHINQHIQLKKAIA